LLCSDPEVGPISSPSPKLTLMHFFSSARSKELCPVYTFFLGKQPFLG